MYSFDKKHRINQAWPYAIVIELGLHSAETCKASRRQNHTCHLYMINAAVTCEFWCISLLYSSTLQFEIQTVFKFTNPMFVSLRTKTEQFEQDHDVKSAATWLLGHPCFTTSVQLFLFIYCLRLYWCSQLLSLHLQRDEQG